jgi:hypothetical protein
MQQTLPHVKRTSASRTFVSKADEAILRAVNRYHLVTVNQVCRLLYKPGALTTVRSRVSRLAQANYLLRNAAFQHRIAPGPVVYSLGPKGRSYLASLGEAVPERLRKGVVTDYGFTHLTHALGVTDLLIAADLVTKHEPRVTVQTLLHEHALQRKGVRVTLADGSKAPVQPDAWIDFRLRQDRTYQTCIAVEFDRGTEHQPKWRAKVHALLAWSRGPYRELFGTDSLTIAVLTTAGEERHKALLRWTEVELTARNAQAAADLFCFAFGEPATIPPDDLFLGRRWVSPFAATPTALLELAQGAGCAG